jgi:MFS family permease
LQSKVDSVSEHTDVCFPEDFGNPTGGYQGILASSLPLGAMIGLPFIPFVNDKFGRRWCIMFGSLVMIFVSES